MSVKRKRARWLITFNRRRAIIASSLLPSWSAPTLNKKPVFISHSSKDDEFIRELRLALEGQGLTVSGLIRASCVGGNKLAPEIEQAIEGAPQFIVVLSPNTVNSPWVRKEIQKALEVERRRKPDGYRVIALLRPGIEPAGLALWFDEEPVGVHVDHKPGGLSEALSSDSGGARRTFARRQASR